MAEWRFLSGWTDAELQPRLHAAQVLRENVPAFAKELTPETGWNHVRSQAVIAREPPGPPLPDGAYAHAKRLVSRLAYSDARIVVGHFAPGVGLRGRTLLLELKSLGLHYLCPARIGAVREDAAPPPTEFAAEHGERSRAPDETSFGFRLDTLQGHIERGREWFLLTKKHASGEIWFSIEAGWLPGDFPNWWSELGFHFLGRRYQRAWHRLAHEHLRAALQRWNDEDRGAKGAAPVHEGVPLAPVQFFAQKALRPGRARLHEEAEHMRAESWQSSVAFGALAGMRSLLPPALIAVEKSQRAGDRKGPLPKVVASAMQLAALGELLADKLPGMPSRTGAVPLLGRAASGAFAGALVSPGRKLRGALLGAGAAIGASFVLARLRGAAARTKVTNVLAGLAEDALALNLGTRVASTLP